jgi:negative regulator of flagellin synthesis FlgM
MVLSLSTEQHIKAEQDMKIENGAMNSTAQMEHLLKNTAQHPAAETQQTQKRSTEAYSVDLSPTAEQQRSTQNADEISRERVAAIRDQLASGTYNISGKDVANKILGVLKK